MKIQSNPLKDIPFRLSHAESRNSFLYAATELNRTGPNKAPKYEL